MATYVLINPCSLQEVEQTQEDILKNHLGLFPPIDNIFIPNKL